MEGGARRRLLPLLAAMGVCLLAALAAGCGDSSDGEVATVRTTEPEVAFAPVVHHHPEEPFMPMDARWFIDRSMLWISYGSACEAGKIAVGRVLKPQHTQVADWIYVPRLGWGIGYWRQVYADLDCQERRQRHRYYANQLTRPREDRPDRAPGLQLDEGYYLDLADRARSGPAAIRDGGQAVVDAVDVWYERRPAEVDGDPGIRITYWMLYGMNRPTWPDRVRPLTEMTHEGDWQRIEVLLGEGDGDDEWEPRYVRVTDPAGKWRTLRWESLRRERGPGARAATHPVLFAARGTHTPYTKGGRHDETMRDGDGEPMDIVEVVEGPCRDCPRWRTWETLSEARQRDWYGFGGAWGEVGPTTLSTGPLGPHGKWATPIPGAQYDRWKSRP